MSLDPTYRTALLVPDDDLGSVCRVRGSMQQVADADLVVSQNGVVLKDRVGRTPRTDPAFMALARELPSPRKR